MKADQPDLTLVIPSYNTQDLVTACVRSILAHQHGLRCEIIVVDDNSSDATTEQLRAQFPQIQVLRNEVNLGYGGAANRGLELARGRHVAVLNSDIALFDDALVCLVHFLDHHPQAGAVAPRLLNTDRTHQKSISRHPTVIANFIRLVVPRQVFEQRLMLDLLHRVASSLNLNLGRLAADPTTPVVVECVMGAFFVVRHEVLDQSHGFDSQNFYMFVEESDWFIRIQRAGWQVYYVPEAEVIHYGSMTVRQFRHRYMIQQYKSFLRFYEKHGGTATVLSYKALLTPIFAARALSYRLLALLPGRRQQEWLRRFETYMTIVRLFFDPALQAQNVLREMTFTYIPPPPPDRQQRLDASR